MSTIKQIVVTALVAALVSGVGVPYAKKHLINGNQIKKGTIKGKQVKFPQARLVGRGATAAGGAHAAISGEYSQVAVLGTYKKLDGQSVLRIDWTGAVGQTYINRCVFQLRVDGHPGSGGEVPLLAGNPDWITTSALFTGMSAGQHTVQVWARVLDYSGVSDERCVIDPEPQLPASQTTATEIVQ